MSNSNSSESDSGQGWTDPNFPNPNGEYDTPIIIYGYTPSLPLAAFAASWFFLLLLAHSWRVSHHRAWWLIPIPVGLFFEIVGYISRSLSARKNPYNLIYFVLNYFFIVTAPVFFAAGIFTVLSVLVRRYGRQYSIASPKAILAFFITSDAIATILQIVGAALVGSAESNDEDPTKANNILLGGLAYQVFSMTIFVIVLANFAYRGRAVLKQDRKVLFTAILTLVTLLIYLRTIFRLAETAQGLYGSLSTNEVFFACLEFAPVALAMLLLAIWFPAAHLAATPGSEHVEAEAQLSQLHTPENDAGVEDPEKALPV